MRQKQTVGKFLAAVDEKIKELESSTWVDESAEVDEVDQVKLFEAITLQRKCLESIANDIYEAAYGVRHSSVTAANGKKNTSVGKFPVGATQSDFRSRIGATHPNLASIRPDLYDLIESVQPHKLWRSTIRELVEIRNEAEHDDLPQTVEPTTQRSYKTPGMRIVNSKNVVVKGNTYNGEPTPNFTVDGDGKLKDFSGDQSQLIAKKRSRVTVTGSTVDVIDLLKASQREIDQLQQKVYSII